MRDQVRDRLECGFQDLGERQLKNIARPVRVYALNHKAVANLLVCSTPTVAQRRRWWQSSTVAAMAAAAALILAIVGWRVWPVTMLSLPSTTSGSVSPSPSKPLVAPRLSIVVLPFASLSNDAAQQYFADGITEDLTTDLSQIPHMLVISAATAFTYKNKPISAKQLGHELGVRYVIEGSVERFGNLVRFNAQLIDAETDKHQWAERFDINVANLFAVQSEITYRLATALDRKLIAIEAARQSDPPDALDYILRGLAATMNARTPGTFSKSIEMFEQALSIDPRSIEAQVRLGLALTGRVLAGMSNSSGADIARATELIEQSLTIYPGSTLAHLARGHLLRAERRCDEAIPEYEMVIRTNPNSADAFFGLGLCKLVTGSIDEVIPLEEKAIRLIPPDAAFASNLYLPIGEVQLLRSHIDEAIASLERARTGNPASMPAHVALAAAYGLKGDRARANTELDDARRLGGRGYYPSIANLSKAGPWSAPKIRAMSENTFVAGLRKAGAPEE